MKNSLEQYIKCQAELYDRQTLICDQGFIVYKPLKDGFVYIHLAYVEKEYRNQGVGSTMVQKVMDHTNATDAISYIDSTTKNTEDALLAHLLAGFKVLEVNGNNINMVFTREKNEDNKQEGDS